MKLQKLKIDYIFSFRFSHSKSGTERPLYPVACLQSIGRWLFRLVDSSFFLSLDFHSKRKSIPFRNEIVILVFISFRWYQRSRRICSLFFNSKCQGNPHINEMIINISFSLSTKNEKLLIVVFLHTYVTIINYREKISMRCTICPTFFVD